MRLRTLDFQGIHNATLRILYRTGLRVHGIGDRGMAATLAGAGLMVEGETVRFPPEVLEGLVSQAPREVHLHAPGGQAVTLSQEAPLVMADGTGIFVMEEGGQTRPSASRDVHRAVILQNSLANYDIVRPMVTSREYAEWEDLADFFVLLACVSKKPVCHRTMSPAHAPLAMELASIALQDHGYYGEHAPFSVIYCTKSPLTITAENLASIKAYGQIGTPVFLLTMPLAGATAPFSPLGCVVMANAEMLGSIALVQAMCPGLPVVYGTEIVLVDMRSSYAAFGAPEYHVSNAMAMEVAAWYNLPGLCGAGATDAKSMDAQMGMEKACSFLYAMERAHVLFGAGATDSAHFYHIPCLVLDNEILGMAKALRRLGAATEDLEEVETLIEQVGAGSDYLGHDHTFQHCREFWQPELFARASLDQVKRTGGSLGDRARERARKMYEDSQAVAVSEQALKAMEDLFRGVTGMEPPSLGRTKE